MKVESRGKYPGVKLHLEPEECSVLTLLAAVQDIKGPQPSSENVGPALKLAIKMGKKILELKEETPDLLEERTPEQIAAILAKEVEAATLKLDRMKAGKDWKKIDQSKLQEALNKHVKKD